MARAPQPQYVRAREAFFGCLKEGDPDTMENFNPGEVVVGSHPAVKKWPDKFVPLEPDRSRPAVEQATAAPGEVRG